MAKIKMGIVGLPNVGKSTLFNILTKQSVTAANYPFATIDSNVGVVPVPDERLTQLSALNNSRETIPTIIEFYDIAGLVRGANKGEGLGNQFLSHIKETDAVVHVVRCFSGEEVVHIEGGVDASRDIDIIEAELMLKDLDTVEQHLNRIAKNIRSGDTDAKKEQNVLSHIKSDLLKGKMPNISIKHIALLTDKPQLLLLNGSEKDATKDLINKVQNLGFDYVVIDLSSDTNLALLIQKSYEVLGLITFFTTGEKESRAWTIPVGASASEAAGIIHSDFEQYFIRAEVVSFDQLIEAGSWSNARSKGWLRVEGRDYVVKDGDVMHFRTGA